MRPAGFTLVDLLVGTALGVVTLSALTAAIGAGGRLLATTGARAEVDDTVQLAVEALTFDVRRAGYDPAGAGVAPLTEAKADRVGFSADLDGDGLVDPNSEEVTTWVCVLSPRRLSRYVGRQSLPLAEDVTRCAFRYLDDAGNPLATPAAGLDDAGRARVRAVALDLTLRPPRLAAAAARTVLVALRAVR